MRLALFFDSWLAIDIGRAYDGAMTAIGWTQVQIALLILVSLYLSHRLIAVRHSTRPLLWRLTLVGVFAAIIYALLLMPLAIIGLGP